MGCTKENTPNVDSSATSKPVQNTRRPRRNIKPAAPKIKDVEILDKQDEPRDMLAELEAFKQRRKQERENAARKMPKDNSRRSSTGGCIPPTKR